jgi:hypothetical protein
MVKSKTTRCQPIDNEIRMLIVLRIQQNQVLTVFSAIQSAMNKSVLTMLFLLTLTSTLIEGQRNGT